MIKFITILNEIVDSPYSLSPPIFHKENNFRNYVDYEFTTDNKREYYIRFDNGWTGTDKTTQKYNWATELTFFPKELSTSKGDDTEVGDENFGKILATVSKALKEYTTKYKPEYVYWKGIKGNKETKVGDSNKRQRIYNMVMDKMASGITGYTSIKGDRVSGILTKDEIPIPGINKIFTYPEKPSFYNEEEAKNKRSRFDQQK